MARPRCYQLPRASFGAARSFYRKYLFPVRPIPILNAQGDRCSDGLPVTHSRKDVSAIFLDLLPPTTSIAKLPAVQIVIDEFQVHRQPRRQSRQKRQECLPVRLTRGIEAQHKLSSVAAPLTSVQQAARLIDLFRT